MLNNIKSATKNSLIYSFGNLSIKIIGLILIPIYTDLRYLSTDDYGILGLLEVSSQVLTAVLGLSLTQALTRWYWDKKYLTEQKSIYFTLLIFSISITTIFLLVSYNLKNTLSVLMFNKTDFGLLIYLMIITACINVISVYPQTLMKLQQKALFFSLTNIIKLVITLVFTLYFIIYKHKKVEGIFLAQIIGGISFLLLILPYTLKNIALKLNFFHLKEMIIYSLPLMLATISGLVLSTFDRYALNYFNSLYEVGVYSLGFRIANTLKIFIVTSVQMAMSPLIFKMMDNPNRMRFYSKYMTYFAFGLMIAVIGLSLFGMEIVKLFATSTEYWSASTIIPIICFSVFFGMLKDTSLTGLQIKKKTKIIGVIVTAIAILNLILNIIFIPKYKIYGASVATLISQILFFIIMYYYAQKQYLIPYEIKKVLLIITVGSCLIIPIIFINHLSLFYRVILKSALIILFPIILYFLNFYETIELQRLSEFWEKWNNPKEWKNNIKEIKTKP